MLGTEPRASAEVAVATGNGVAVVVACGGGSAGGPLAGAGTVCSVAGALIFEAGA